MKYYSEVTKELYNSEKELNAAEAKEAIRKTEIERKKMEEEAKRREYNDRKTAEKAKVDEAFTKYMEAWNNYVTLKDEFVKTYGYYSNVKTWDFTF